ncbi:MAG: VWA domain-containing protein, partial [Candidatus Omnitrophica bacterium]|nr:VWA domain-containing protein [Candidatus Omnitrophota bacterium]
RKQTVFLSLALLLYLLVHTGLAFYLSRTVWNPGASSLPKLPEKLLEVRMVEDLQIPDFETQLEIEKILQEDRLRVAAEEGTVGDLPQPEEPETDWSIPTVEQVIPDTSQGSVPLPDIETQQESGPETEIDLAVVQIPAPRVEAPQPDLRVWEPKGPETLPEVALAAPSLPPLPALSEMESLDPAEPFTAPLEERVDLPATEFALELPEEIEIAYPDPIEPEAIEPLEAREDFMNWDEYLEVKIDAHRPSTEAGFFRVKIQPNAKAESIRPMAKDLIIAIDASGSIDPVLFEEVKKGLIDSLPRLRKGDRFNILAFKADIVALNSGLWQVTPDTIRRSQEFIGDLDTSGKTDIYRSLSSVVRSLPRGDRPFQLILFTDGLPTAGLQDSAELINRLTVQNDQRASIHTFAVGPNSNRDLLHFLSYRNKGFAEGVEFPETAASSVKSLMSLLETPLLMDVVMDFSGLPSGNSHPLWFRDLYRTGQIEVYGRYRDEKELVLRLSGDVRGRNKEFIFKGDLPDIEPANAEIATRWAQAKRYDDSVKQVMGKGVDSEESVRVGAPPPVFRGALSNP